MNNPIAHEEYGAVTVTNSADGDGTIVNSRRLTPAEIKDLKPNRVRTLMVGGVCVGLAFLAGLNVNSSNDDVFTSSSATEAAQPQDAETEQEAEPEPSPSVTELSDEEAAKQCISELPIEKKLGYLTVVAVYDKNLGVYKSALDENGIRNVILMKQLSAEQISDLTGNDKPGERIGDDIFVTTDQEGGEVQRFTVGYNTITAASKVSDLAAYGRELQKNYKHLWQDGVHGVFAPVQDVAPKDNPDGHTLNTRVFSDQPEEVAEKAGVQAKALNDNFLKAVGKHFPGDMLVNTDYSISKTIDIKDMGRDIEPFAINYVNYPNLSTMMGNQVVPGLAEDLGDEVLVEIAEELSQENATLAEIEAIKIELEEKTDALPATLNPLAYQKATSIGAKNVFFTDALNAVAIQEANYTQEEAAVLAWRAGAHLPLIYPTDGQNPSAFIAGVIKAGQAAVKGKIIPEGKINASYYDVAMFRGLTDEEIANKCS